MNTYPFNVKATEKAFVQIILAEIATIVCPQECQETCGCHFDLPILKLFPCPVLIEILVP